ncbi:MAG: TetR family transcriptional regulator [Lachnospiraceae bacterium]|nr:TetR family transcriptional regulator [Lachnospiraceae bacterium]
MHKDMKLQIAEQLREMAKDRSIDKITVTALVERCSISRQTFYYHFRDIPDVVEWYFNKGLDDMVQSIPSHGLNQETVRAFVDVFMNYAPFMQNLMASQRLWKLEGVIVNNIRRFLGRMLLTEHPDSDLKDPDLQVALDFGAYGMAGIIRQNMLLTPNDGDRLSKQIYKLLTAQR